MQPLPTEVFNAAEVRMIEAGHARTHNGHCYDLMEKAGRSVFRYIMEEVRPSGVIWSVCGRGNNGGDGYITASCCQENRVPHRVFAVGTPHGNTEAYTAYEYYLSLGGRIEYELPGSDEQPPAAAVDALLGTGIKSAPAAPFDEWILRINQLNTTTVAVDIPSGVSADTGAVPGNCVEADATVCMLALKPGLFTGDAVDFVGRIVFADLGLDVSSQHGRLRSLDGGPALPIKLRPYESIVPNLPRRTPSVNKGDAGKVLIIGGAPGMGGAAVISGCGALRCGAGLVKVALDPSNIPALNAFRPELMSLDFNDIDAVERGLDWADVIAIGPGLSQSPHARDLVELCRRLHGYVIFDADALNIIARLSPEVQDKRIMTPHPGEAARLLKCQVSAVNADRIGACRKLQEIYGGVVLLKGAGTIICDGRRITIVHEGSPAMASGGMGDLLTGMIASLLAQGLTARQAVEAAACIHGRAGALAGQEAEIGTIASDLCPFIRRLVNGKI